jgi:hypothetical protein
MDVPAIARWASASERRIDMTQMRTCVGSAKFGIVAHEAPVADFPNQPSQKDGLGRMCKIHWREYVSGLARDAKARAAGTTAETTVEIPAAARVATKRAAGVTAAKPASTKRARKKPATPPAPEKVAKVRKAKALIDAIDVLPGPEHVAAIATDEAQAALEVLSEPAQALIDASPFALPDPRPVRDVLAEEASTT